MTTLRDLLLLLVLGAAAAVPAAGAVTCREVAPKETDAALD